MEICIHNKTFTVDPGPFETGWKHIGSGNWEPDTFRIIDHFVGPEDIVLDLGAWAGPVTLYAAHTAKRVIAADPDHVAFEQLEQNVALNPLLREKIKCCEVAIAGSEKRLPLYARKAYGLSSSSLLERTRDRISSETVRATTLRQFVEAEVAGPVHFIKMDIEGGEFDVLAQTGSLLPDMGFPTLFVSFHYTYLKEYHYRQAVGIDAISRLLMKTEQVTGLDFLRSRHKAVIRHAIKDLHTYTHIYTSTGIKLEFNMIMQNPLLIKANDLVFTNKAWE